MLDPSAECANYELTFPVRRYSPLKKLARVCNHPTTSGLQALEPAKKTQPEKAGFSRRRRMRMNEIIRLLLHFVYLSTTQR